MTGISHEPGRGYVFEDLNRDTFRRTTPTVARLRRGPYLCSLAVKYFPTPGRGFVTDDFSRDIAPHRPYRCLIGWDYVVDDKIRDNEPNILFDESQFVEPVLPLPDRGGARLECKDRQENDSGLAPTG